MYKYKEPLNVFIGTLIIINIILSSYFYYSLGNDTSFCVIGEGCDIVKKSAYSEIFGIKVSLFGAIAFIALFIVFALGFRDSLFAKIYFVMVSIGLLFALYFLYLQIFIIGTICSTCAVIDSIAILIFLTTLYCATRKR